MWRESHCLEGVRLLKYARHLSIPEVHPLGNKSITGQGQILPVDVIIPFAVHLPVQLKLFLLVQIPIILVNLVL
jgi:hypothetical protein